MAGAAYDMVRIGHAAYDGAMSVTSRVIAVREAKAGECVGYGHFRLARDTSLAVVFGGYFDGVYRESPSPVVINGKICPVVGSVCMDMFAVDAGGTEARTGDEAVLLGGALSASYVAAARGTSDYEVMTCWHGRVERKYVDEKGSTAASECRGGSETSLSIANLSCLCPRRANPIRKPSSDFFLQWRGRFPSRAYAATIWTPCA